MLRLTIKIVYLLMVLNLALAVSGARAERPTDVVKDVVDEVVAILKNPAYHTTGGANSERRKLMKETVDRRFDYREMAKRSLGATWNGLSSAQREDFVHLFAQLLEASYSDKIEKYGASVKIDYVGESMDDGYAEVRTMVVRPNDRIPISYRLFNESGRWMIYDVTIEGVSLVSNYRSQFRQVISESSYTELVRRLRTKVDELRRMG